MSVLAILPDRNSPGRHDWSGGFRPWAVEWQHAHGGALVQIDLSLKPWQRRRDVLGAIQAHAPETLALFTHGLQRFLPQFAIGPATIRQLALTIASVASSPRIVLYACSTGSGPGIDGDKGFADTLRDELCTAGAKGCQVDAHVTAGRADANPTVRRFVGPVPAVGGQYLVDSSDPLWSTWRQALTGRMRWEFPFLTAAEIRARLTSP